MQNYVVNLKSPVSTSFRCQKAANSLDIDSSQKSVHSFSVSADLKTDFNVGLIVGASGSGKTTLAKEIWGQDVFKSYLDDSKPVIEQFPKEWSYDDCSKALNGIGLTSVPCWIRPVYTLSNGQKARAEAAIALSKCGSENVVIDEWTSVVDRVVAKVMSHCVQKYARRTKSAVVLLSCHYDIAEWLDPDWIIDCNEQKYIERRDMVGTEERRDRLRCDIREIDSKSWKYFSKYHYLSARLPAGKLFLYGLFIGDKQIGFQCYAAYLPGYQHIMYSNRVVIHPDYASLGMGIKFINKTASMMKSKGYVVRATFSSIPLYKSRMRDKENWKLMKIEKPLRPLVGKTMDRHANQSSFRTKVTVFKFQYVGP